jgi:LmbE family N-acetylglucosaminyl deacetylase
VSATPPVALALSPHLDDAAFSCGGTLAMLADAGWDVVVATLFTASVPDPQGFALACQLDKGLGPEVDYMALRRDEDRAAMNALGARALHRPHREAPHRGYHAAPVLFEAPHAGDGVAADLAPDLAALIAQSRPTLLLAPQAIGGHVDHVMLLRALDAVGPAVATLWWRDFPYTVRDARPKAPFAARFEELPEIEVRLHPRAQMRKRAACAAYASQIGFQFGGADGLARRLKAEEGRERLRCSGRLPDGLPLPLAG